MKSKVLSIVSVFILLIVFYNTMGFVRKESENTATLPGSNKNIPSKYAFEQLDNTKGLSNSSVNCIFQDSQNLLWIGTWDGLNRYDGKNFKIFRPEQNNEHSLSNQVVLKIDEDNNGMIWILTMHGINHYDKKSGKFRHYYFSRENKPAFSESQFNLALNPSKEVFCAVKDWGLGYFNGSGFSRFEDTGFMGKTVKKLDFSNRGKLYILSEDNKLYVTSVKNSGNGKKTINPVLYVSDDVRTFEILPDDTVCIITTDGAASLFYPATKKIEKIRSKGIEAVAGQFNGGLVFSGKSGGLSDYAGNVIHNSWSGFLNTHKITTVFQGNENILWAGTDGDGIFKIYPVKKSFNLVSQSQIRELNGGIVRSFINPGNNTLLLGTKGRGLFILPSDFYLEPDKILNYKNFNENNSPINNAVFALCNGKENIVYIGSDGQGLAIYDTEKQIITDWKSIEGSQNCDYFKSVYSIYQDNDGTLWLGTNGYGMIRCRIVPNGSRFRITEFKRYTAGNDNTTLSSNIIFSILPRNENELWIGTRLGGLNLFDKASGKFKTYKNNPGNPNSLSNNDILCLATDSINRLWIGTSFGLNLLERLEENGKAVFKSFTVNDGLPNNTIHGIVPNKNANLWISTNFGLSNFIVKEKKFINYTRNEGLQNNEFADGAFYHDKTSGYIFMGGIKGFNFFLPENIKESSFVPDLLIDKISGQNQAIPYYQSLVISPNSNNYPSIDLKHDQNFLDIHLGAITYTNNEKCQYSYRLEGFDQNWNTIGNRTVISLTNIPPGEYSLWMKWSNSDGVWSRQVHAIDINIKPVWWQSNVAFVIYVILGSLFILFVRSYYIKRQTLKQNILIRKNEEELHENKLSFFTNIAHEFLTPLTLIVGPAQKLSESTSLDEKNQKYTGMIQRNASRLLFLTQQLLEFRKAEYDYLENTVRNFDLVNLIEQIAELFDDMALDKEIKYNLYIPKELPGWFDKDKIEKILFNLLSNAFKYTPEKGRIDLKCTIENGDCKSLKISISNTGKGIPEDKIDSLFNRFFLSDFKQSPDNEMFRTGIGLAYIKKLTTVLRGEVSVTSVPDADTTFTIRIPCEKAAFTEKEIDYNTAPVLISQHLKNILEDTKLKPDADPEKISSLRELEDNKKKVLIAEDEREIHAYLDDLLSEKYKIIPAYNGLEAWGLMQDETPDIIISDVMMPEMDGVEFCKMVKTDVRTCHIPFIMLTAKNSVQHRIEGLESGANSYIPKPFYPEHLLVRIQKLLEEKELILKHFSQDTLVENLSIMPLHNTEKAFIKSVIDLIKNNIDNESLDSNYIEKGLGISSSQLYRKCKEIFNLSPGDLIRTIRLKHAAELLRKDILTVSEVCYKSGFNNRSYFYREFNKLYKTTPKNYQLRYKAKSTSFTNN